MFFFLRLKHQNQTLNSISVLRLFLPQNLDEEKKMKKKIKIRKLKIKSKKKIKYYMPVLCMLQQDIICILK